MTAQAVYRTMVRDHVTPALWSVGFTGRDGSFSLPHDDVSALLQFQRSRSSSRTYVSFTVNLLVVSAAEWSALRALRPALPPVPRAGPVYGVGWSSRVGFVLPVRSDHWWSLTDTSDPEVLGSEVASALLDHAYPRMVSEVLARS